MNRELIAQIYAKFCNDNQGDNQYLLFMPPVKFIELTGRQDPSDYADVFDEQRFMRSLEDDGFPELEVHKDGQVMSSEGMHRAVAARDAGIDEIPVFIAVVDYDLVRGHVNGSLTLDDVMSRIVDLPLPQVFKKFDESVYK
jgi:hypothetical protein